MLGTTIQKTPTQPGTSVLGEKLVHGRSPSQALPFTGEPIAVMVAVASILLVGGTWLSYRSPYRGQHEG